MPVFGNRRLQPHVDGIVDAFDLFTGLPGDLWLSIDIEGNHAGNFVGDFLRDVDGHLLMINRFLLSLSGGQSHRSGLPHH